MLKKDNITRIVVRQVIPRKIKEEVKMEKVKAFIVQERQKFQKYLYVGWVRRKIRGKSTLKYLAATAQTLIEAKKRIKYSEAFGSDIWDLTGEIS